MFLSSGIYEGSITNTWEHYGLSWYSQEKNRYLHSPWLTYFGRFQANRTLYFFTKWTSSGNPNPCYLDIIILQ